MIQLPIDDYLPKILELISKNNSLVLTASPGSGKTTRLPPALLQSTDKKIFVLEPRRIAASSAAARIAEEQQFQIGKEVGYQVRFENQTSKETRLFFLTEALLSKKLQLDPQLSDVGIVILDEFHERSIHTDLAIGLLKELQELSRPDLKIVVMSATIQTQQISQFLNNCPILDVPGLLFEKETTQQKENQFLITNQIFIQHCVDKIKTLYSEKSKAIQDTLFFLPGKSEIERLRTALSQWASNNQIEVFILHGSLSLADQRLVLKKINSRKLILCTNVAESAITVDGVNTVIDSGLVRNLIIHSQTAVPRLQLQRISKASATQRAGRSARQGPGIVLQLWNKADQYSMTENTPAEINQTDLAEALLILAEQGVSDFKKFSWFETPTEDRINLAVQQLVMWGALDSHRKITPKGKKMLRLPAHPRIACMLMKGIEIGHADFACEIASVITEKSFIENINPHHHIESDIIQIHESLFDRDLKNNFSMAIKVASQLKNMVSSSTSKKFLPANEKSKVLQELLIASYQDRIAKRRKKGENTFQLIDGKGAELSERSCVKKSEYCFAIDLFESQSSHNFSISLAHELSEDLIESNLKDQIIEQETIQFEENKGLIIRQQQRFLNKIQMGFPRQKTLTAEESAEYLPEIAFNKLELLYKENPSLLSWKKRLDYYQVIKKQTYLSEQQMKEALTEACFGEKSLQGLLSKNLVYFFETKMSSDIVLDFHKSCPEHITVPSGSKIRLNYFNDKNPEAEVRLQEVFGWSNTPLIMNGQIPITLLLLAPNYRPVQTTQDLSSFWKNGYHEVRKELRSRYPKHSWPDDPLIAPAVAKGRSRT